MAACGKGAGGVQKEGVVGVQNVLSACRGEGLARGVGGSCLLVHAKKRRHLVATRGCVVNQRLCVERGELEEQCWR